MTHKTKTVSQVLNEGLWIQEIEVWWHPEADMSHEGVFDGWWAELKWGSPVAPSTTIAEGVISTRYGERSPETSLRFVLGLAEHLGIKRHPDGGEITISYVKKPAHKTTLRPNLKLLHEAVAAIGGLEFEEDSGEEGPGE